ncbi:MAG: trehalose-phosphatase [Candidatus Omnitrophica bacterium]|nr:trehalose-phosphatase [Candidatus Omnitrophota bacterium]
MNPAKHVFDCWSNLAPDIREKDIMLFLDYDGTLTPIVEMPESAVLADSMKMILSELKQIKKISIAVVSGRSLEQLKKFVGIPGLLYVGNHGFEMEGPDIRHVHPGAIETKGIMADVAEVLKNIFKSTPGIMIENKTFTLSVHYRQIPEEKVDRIRMVFLKSIYPFLENGQIVFTEGKKVLEVRPALGWNKGTAVTWLYGRKLAAEPSRRILPIYIGDDSTDEAALKAVKNHGIAVKVMEEKSESYADYYLRNSKEVYDFLKRIQKLKSDIPEN